MSLDELRGLYNEAYKILTRERANRAKAFPVGDREPTGRREPALREIDRAIEILMLIKNELKPHCPDIQQAELLPRKVEYE